MTQVSTTAAETEPVVPASDAEPATEHGIERLLDKVRDAISSIGGRR
ncbi:MAG: hypothetical protein ABSC56_04095 [Solirubrobacteraceae bacterium]|jgi:hypothetical protein